MVRGSSPGWGDKHFSILSVLSSATFPPFSTQMPRPNHDSFMTDLTTSGTTLYNVHALDAPEELDSTEQMIGELVLASSLTTSKWEDESLFFRHQDMAVRRDERGADPSLVKNFLTGGGDTYIHRFFLTYFSIYFH